MGKQVITAIDIEKAMKAGSRTLDFKEADCIVTPDARDKMEAAGIEFAGTACPLAQAEGMPGVDPVPGTVDDDLTARICDLVREKLPSAAGQELGDIVRKVVAARLSGSLDDAGHSKAETKVQGPVSTRGGVSLISGALLFDQSPKPAIAGRVEVSDPIPCHGDSPLTATFMKWGRTTFDRTVEAPEVSLVVEGSFDLSVDGQTFTANPGDILYMEKGAFVEYASTENVKLACVSA